MRLAIYCVTIESLAASREDQNSFWATYKSFPGTVQIPEDFPPGGPGGYRRQHNSLRAIVSAGEHGSNAGPYRV